MGEPGLGPVLDWARARLDQPIAVADLARQAGVSPRTFTRHLHAATGTSPLQWLLHERIRLAQQLLESTGGPVETIAHRWGFGVASGMRRHCVRVAGVSPQAYRRTFHTAAADAASAGAGGSRGVRGISGAAVLAHEARRCHNGFAVRDGMKQRSADPGVREPR